MGTPTKTTRTAAIVIIAAMLLWFAAQWVGGQLGLPARYVFLLDFATLGALLWALIVLALNWRHQRRD